MTLMEQSATRVSVIIRSMDRKSLATTLASVATQTFQALQVIVVNATGKEHSPLPRITMDCQLVEAGRADRAPAANAALDVLDTPLALFLDDDDLLDPHHIERLYYVLEDHPDTPAAYTGVRLEGEGGDAIGITNIPWVTDELLLHNTLPIHAVLFRTDAVLAGQCRFDTQFALLEDWDFWLQLAQQGDFINLPGESATYRLGLGQSRLSANRSAEHYNAARQAVWQKWLPHIPSTRLMQPMAQLIDQLEQNRWDVSQLRKQESMLQHEHSQLLADYQALSTSRSMRLTYPLRWLSQRLDSVRQWGHTVVAHTSPTRGLLKHSLEPPAAQPAREAPEGAIDIIVPVYEGLEETQDCLESVWSATPQQPFRLLVINDASPEPELTAWLREAAATRPMTLLENPDNLGFVGTVNRGMAYSQDADVVLLNSDAEVTNDWLDRLIAAAYRSGERPVASVTPFSNNATICSYPRFCQDNALPEGYTLSEVDSLFARTNAGKSVDIPTGIGFCMYIRRDSLDAIGLFDEANFGKGYGEENDFCMRAIKAGWRNVHALDVFAWHKGSVSFGQSQPARVQKALAVMDRLHPEYSGLVHEFIHQDPARYARAAIEVEQLHQSTQPCVLMLNHQRGGGTEQHCRQLAATLPHINWLILRPQSDSRVVLSRDVTNGNLTLTYHIKNDWQALVDMLRYLGVERLHWHHWLGIDDALFSLADTLNIAQDVTLHDFYAACPHISLTDERGRYAVNAEGECAQCLTDERLGQHDISAWRTRSRQLLEACQRVIAPSRDTAMRLEDFFPGIEIIAAWHPDARTPQASVTPITVRPNEPLRIAVLGALSLIKGADTLERVAQEAHAAGVQVEFKLFGSAYRTLAALPNLSVTGAYQADDLPTMLKYWRPHAVWFPAQWPETYSYTLSTCLELGLPVVAPALGAFPERLAEHPYSWLLPWDTSPSAWATFFTQLRDGQAGTWAPAWHHATARDDFYDSAVEAGSHSNVFATNRYNTPLLTANHPPKPATQPHWQPHLANDAPRVMRRERIIKALYWLRGHPRLQFICRRFSPTLQRRIKSAILGERTQ